MIPPLCSPSWLLFSLIFITVYLISSLSLTVTDRTLLTLTFSVVRRAGAWGFQESHPLDLNLQKFCIILAHFNLHTPFTWLFAPFLSGS